MAGVQIQPGVTPFQFGNQTYEPGDTFETQDPCEFLAFLAAGRAANPDRGNTEEVQRVIRRAQELCPGGAADNTPSPNPQPTVPDETLPSDLAPEDRGDDGDRQGAPPSPPTMGEIYDDSDPLEDDPPPEEEPTRPSDGESDPNGEERGQEDTTAGEPVDIFSGQFRLDEIDLSIPDTVMPLAFRRLYRSGPGVMGPLGWNWDHNYNIFVRELSSGDVAMWRNEREVIFRANGGGFDSQRSVFDILERLPGPGTRFRLSGPGGIVLDFNRPAGWSETERIPVVQMRDRFGNTLDFEYDAENRLARLLETDSGYFLRFGYDDCGLLTSVEDHAGRRWTYVHDEVSLHLTCVEAPATRDHPDGTRRVYHYAPYTAHSGLRHAIVRITDGADRTYLENFYVEDPGDWSFGRVCEQLVGGDLFQFRYTQLQWVAPLDVNMNAQSLRVEVTNPDLGLETYTFNFRGDLLDRRFRLVKDGSYRIVVWRYAYDVQGNRTETVASDGSIEVLTFDAGNADPRARGNLLRRELRASPAKPAPSRIVTRRTYHPIFQLVAEEIDEFGARTRYRYDTDLTPGDPANAGRLLRVELPDTTLPDGAVQAARVEMAYRANGQLETVTGADGAVLRLDYGASANDRNRIVARTADAAGAAIVTSFGYDAAGYLTTTTTPEGHTYTTETNVRGQVEARRLPDVDGSDALSIDRYDADGALIAREMPKGAYDNPAVPGPRLIDEIERDLQGHSVRMRHAANTPEARETVVCRDFRGLPLRIDHPDGSVEKLTYDERGLLLRRRLEGSDGTAVEERRVYDRTGRPVRAIATNGMEQVYEYDGFGRLREERSSNGSVRLSTWAGDRLVQVDATGPDGSGTVRLLSRRQFEYDERGRRVAESRRAFTDNPTAGQNVRRTIFHDPADRPLRLVDARGGVVASAFDGLGRLTERQLPDGNRTTFVYDNDGNLVTQTDHHLELSGAVTQFPRSYVCDARGRQREVVEPDGASHVSDFDDRKLEVRRTDPLGTAVALHYDALGDLTARVFDPGGLDIEEHWSRDTMGRVTAYTDPDGQISSYQHDGLGRLRELRYPTGHVSRLTWNARGLPATERLATGVEFRYTHDAHARLIRIENTVSPAPIEAVPTVTYAYDGLDRIVRADTGAGVVERAYDSFSRLIIERSGGVSLTCAYDDLTGEVTKTWPDGRQEMLEHDLAGGLSRIRQTAAGALGTAAGDLFRVDKSGPARPGRLTYASGLQAEFAYDTRKRVSEIAIGGGGAGAFSGTLRFFYDAADRIRARDVSWRALSTAFYAPDARSRLLETRSGFSAPQPAAADQADHDAAVAAIAAAAAADVETFTYGSSDERLTGQMPGLAAQNFTYIPGHRPSSDGAEAYAFGADGTLRSAGTLATRVDALGRITEVQRGGAPVCRLAYDALGRPSSVSEAGQPTRSFAYFGAFAEQEMDDGAPVRQLSLQPGSGQPVALHDAGRTLVPHFDARHTLMATTDLAGAEVERYDYSAFGMPRVTDAVGAVLPRSAVGVDPIFGGQRFLPASSLYLSRRRLFDPEPGLFLSMDPKGYPDSPSLYVYAGQDPVNNIDPNGEAVPFIIAALAIAGALGGAGYSFYDAYHHPEKYEGWTGSLRAFGNTVGGGIIGGLAGLAGEAVLALGGVGAFAEGSAVTLTTAQSFGLYGSASAASGAVGRFGFHGLFPEYIDPVSAETIATDFALGGGLFVVGRAVAPYAQQFTGGVVEFSRIARESIRNGALRNGAREMWTRTINGNWRAIGNTWRLLRNPNLRHRYGWRELFYNRRPNMTDAASSASIRPQYWSQTPNGARADGKALHHWFFQNQNSLIPQGIKDNAFNLLEVPGPLNTWMGGRLGREWSFRIGVLTILGLDFASSYMGTRAIIDGATGDDEPGSAGPGGPVGDLPQMPNDLMGSK